MIVEVEHTCEQIDVGTAQMNSFIGPKRPLLTDEPQVGGEYNFVVGLDDGNDLLTNTHQKTSRIKLQAIPLREKLIGRASTSFGERIKFDI